MDDVKNALINAKKLIENGWCQRKALIFRSNDIKEYCVLGAIGAAADKSALISSMKQVFTEANNIAMNTVIWWNDTPGRTKEEVLEAFDKAINLC